MFLGGSFYSVSIAATGLADDHRSFTPVIYLISGFRWSFFGMSDVPVGLSLLAIAGFTLLCMYTIYWIFRTGWRLRQ